jgi:hypothetical protein
VLLSGCSGLAGDASDTFDADAVPRLTLEEEIRIGSLEDPDVGFSRIAGVQVAPDGTVFVLEAQDRQVRVYDQTGRLERRIGGQGPGPGELQSPSSLQLLGDTVVVSEMAGNARITLYGRDGALIRTIPARGLTVSFEDAPGFQVQLRPYRLRSDGRIDPNIVSMVFGDRVTQQGPDSVRIPRVIFDPTGATADTVGYFWQATPSAVRAGGITIPSGPALPSSDLRGTLESDTVVVRRPVAEDAAEGLITVIRIAESGDTVHQRRLRYTPHVVEPAYRDSVLESRLAGYASRPQLAVDLNAVRGALESNVPWPPFHPPVSSMRFGSDGSVWLRREDTDSVPRWTVLDADGEPRGEVLLPRTTTVHWSDRETLWAAERDAFDVPWLVRYRIRDG